MSTMKHLNIERPCACNTWSEWRKNIFFLGFFHNLWQHIYHHWCWNENTTCKYYFKIMHFIHKFSTKDNRQYITFCNVQNQVLKKLGVLCKVNFVIRMLIAKKINDHRRKDIFFLVFFCWFPFHWAFCTNNNSCLLYSSICSWDTHFVITHKAFIFPCETFLALTSTRL